MVFKYMSNITSNETTEIKIPKRGAVNAIMPLIKYCILCLLFKISAFSSEGESKYFKNGFATV